MTAVSTSCLCPWSQKHRANVASGSFSEKQVKNSLSKNLFTFFQATSLPLIYRLVTLIPKMTFLVQRVGGTLCKVSSEPVHSCGGLGLSVLEGGHFKR